MTLDGGPLTIPMPAPPSFSLGGSGSTATKRSAWLASEYFLDQDPARSAALDVTNTLALLKTINFAGYKPSNSAAYPTSSFGTGLRSAAALIKAQIGVEAIQIDIGGWDTHVAEGPLNGSLFGTMSDFSNSIGAFWADVLQGNGTYNVTLVAMSEFGRNVRENGNQGTDHGRGGVMFTMGHNITGGQRAHEEFPGARDAEFDGRAGCPGDYRSSGCAGGDRGEAVGRIPAQIWPGYTPTFQGVTK